MNRLLFVVGLAGGVIGGALLTGIGWFASEVYLLHWLKTAPGAEKMSRVVVAARDLAPGTKLTYDDLSVRNVPETLATPSTVSPDSASYILNQLLLTPANAGEPLLWSEFPVPKDKRVSPRYFDVCLAAVSAREEASQHDATVAAIRDRLGEGAR